MIRVEVRGIPSTKGSLRAGVSRTGKTFVTESQGERLKTWREQLSAALGGVAPADGPIAEPVAVFVTFRLPRPKKPRWPWPAARNRADADKLLRCILDHLSGVIVEDDSQVVLLCGAKVYGTPGATIVIEEVSKLARRDMAVQVQEGLLAAFEDVTQELADVELVMA